MTNIISRQTSGTGVTVKGSPLTNAEIDANFISLKNEKASLAGDTFTGLMTFAANFQLKGSSTGLTTFASANTGSGNFTLTFPALTDTVAVVGTAQSFSGLQTFLNGITSTAATNNFGATIVSTLNSLTITSSTGTLTIAAAKTVTHNATHTFAGTDGTTFTFPAASGTVLTASLQSAISNPSNYAANFGTGALTAGAGNFGYADAAYGVYVNGSNAAGSGSAFALKSNGTVIGGIYRKALWLGSGTSDDIAIAATGNVLVYPGGGATAVGSFSSTGLAVTGNVTTSLKSSTFNTVDTNALIVNSSYGSPAQMGIVAVQRAGATKGYIGLNASDYLSFQNSIGTEVFAINATGLAVTGATTSSGTIKTTGGNIEARSGNALYLYNAADNAQGIWYNTGATGVANLTARMGGADVLTISSAGLAVTGALTAGAGTFSGGVTAQSASDNKSIKLERTGSVAGSGYIYANANDMFGVNDGTKYPFQIKQTAPSGGLVYDAAGLAVAGTLSATGAIAQNNGTVSTTLNSDGGATGYVGTATNHPLGILVNNAEKARIDASGNFGLGVTPSGWSTVRGLQVGTAAYFSGYVGANGMYTGANAYYDGATWKAITTGAATQYESALGAHIWKTAASVPSGSAVAWAQAMTLESSGLALQLGSHGGGLTKELKFNSYRDVDPSNVGAIIKAVSTLTGGVADKTELQFWVNNHASSAYIPYQAMTLDASGNLLLQQTATGFAAANAIAIQAPGGQIIVNHENTSTGAAYLQFGYNAGGIGSITQNGTTGVLYNTSSDYRLKNITGPITGYKERIMALEPETGTWKADGSYFAGFVAHKFQAVYPGSVTGTKDAVDADGNAIMQSMQASSAEVMADVIALQQDHESRLSALRAEFDAYILSHP